MNKRIDALKKKLATNPHKNEMVALIDSIQEKAEQDAKDTSLAKATEKSLEIFEAIRGLVANQDKSFQDIINYLERKSIELDNKSDNISKVTADVVRVISKLTNSINTTQAGVQKVSINNPSQVKMNAAQLKSAFSDALDKVENLLINNNEVPISGKNTFDADGNVTSIREVYKNKTVVTAFKYNAEGNMTSWTTKEI